MTELGALEDALTRHLLPQSGVSGVSWMAATGSTNADLRSRVDWPAGQVLIAEAQHAGRGRLGRAWQSPPGLNLYLSVLLKPQIPPENAPHLGLAAALALRAAFEQRGLTVDLKWPNDLLVRGRKIAGILSEMSVCGSAELAVVIGVGVNLNTPSALMDPQHWGEATSFLVETGEPTDRPAFAAAFLNELGPWVRALQAQGPEAILQPFREQTLTLGREVVYQGDGPGRVVVGTAETIDGSGGLVIRDGQGRLHTITAGDVRLR